MKIGIQLYDEDGCGVGQIIVNVDTIPELIKTIDAQIGRCYSYELFLANENDKTSFEWLNEPEQLDASNM